MGETLPGYDTWKLAAPPEYQMEWCECDECGDSEVDPDDAHAAEDNRTLCDSCWRRLRCAQCYEVPEHLLPVDSELWCPVCAAAAALEDAEEAIAASEKQGQA